MKKIIKFTPNPILNTPQQIQTNATVRVNFMGVVSLYSNCHENGQGADTVMVAITAEELGLDMDEVKLVQPSGEGTTAPIAPAIANAIHMATGIEISELPLDPESIWRLLKNQRETRGAKVS